jgi:hypothetical protein
MNEETITPLEVLEDVDTVVCNGCGEDVAEDSATTIGGQEFCNSCEGDYLACNDCGEAVTVDDSRSYGSGDYCDYCYESVAYMDCEECGDSTHRDEIHDGQYCYSCYQGRNEEDEDECGGPSRSVYREYTDKNLAEFQSKDSGVFITSERIFSAELEAYYPDSDAVRRASAAIPQGFGVSHDGSLGARGIEFQTPKLKGGAGEENIRKICKVLAAEQFTVNRSTGLHLHLDGQGLMPKNRTKEDPRALRNMLRFYLAYEDVLLSFLPASRRGNNYCRHLRTALSIAELETARTLEAVEQMWYRSQNKAEVNRCKRSKYHDSRYYGVNVHSLLKDGHLEIRYHSGTLNPQKILYWVALHQAILDGAVNDFRDTAPLPPRPADDAPFSERVAYSDMAHARQWAATRFNANEAYSATDLKEKTEKMFNVLALSQGAREYFAARQEVFTSTREDKGERDSLTEICAE